MSEQPSGTGTGDTSSPETSPRDVQLALVRDRVRRTRTRLPSPPAARDPVAQVVVDLPLSHLDRPFDYLVPESMAETAVPGARVRVRLAGQAVTGFVLGRVASSQHTGSLTRLSAVVSAEPALSAEVAALARAVADRWAGTLADVLRLAVPPRHARVEAEAVQPAPPPPPAPSAGPWAGYDQGPEWVAALLAGAPRRAVWTALPQEDWALCVATAVAATLAGGHGAVVVVPDGRDLDRVDAALGAVLGPDRHVALSAQLGPAERYRRWLRVRRGTVRAVVGTRAAAFAPVADLGLVVVWDDGDDSHAEPHAPYPHVRELLGLRAHLTGAAMLVGGTAMTAEGAQLVATGWAGAVAAPRALVRSRMPRVVVAGDDAELARDGAAAAARLPSLAWRTAHEALTRGPVLVQVPRRGYVPRLSCQSCREPARCTRCSGPLALPSAWDGAACTWCGRAAQAWSCPRCEGTHLRAQVVGARRTAEELGRAFPSVAVRTSGRDGVLTSVPAAPCLVVATPGAEPVAEGGYAAALLLDGWALLGRPDLRAGEEALRRWLAAATLVRPASAGGSVVLVADPTLAPVQALVRWDPRGHAERELADRDRLGFPPAARVAVVLGPHAAVTEVLDAVRDVPGGQVLGPVPAADDGPRAGAGADMLDGGSARVRAVVRVPRAQGLALARALHVAAAQRSARKAGDPVQVRVDPSDLG